LSAKTLLLFLELCGDDSADLGEDVEFAAAEVEEETLLRFARGLGCGFFWTGLLSSESDMAEFRNGVFGLCADLCFCNGSDGARD
jgi:hypothetical protein